jgi:hypothetical protein
MPTPPPAEEKVVLDVVLSSYWQEEWWTKLIDQFEADHPSVDVILLGRRLDGVHPDQDRRRRSPRLLLATSSCSGK